MGYNPGDSLLESSEDCSEEVKRPGYMWFWQRGTCSQAHILVKGYCYSQGTDSLVNGVSAFLSMRRCEKLDSKNFLLKISDDLRASSASFPRAQSASSWLLPWIPFRVYCRSVTTVATDLTRVELDSGQHYFTNHSLLVLIFIKVWEAFRDQFVLWC